MALVGVWAGALPAPARTLVGAAAPDSLLIVQAMVDRQQDCVAALAITARQFSTPDSTTATTKDNAAVFRSLASVLHRGGDIGTALIFAETGSVLAASVFADDSPQIAPYLLTEALAVRLSGRPDARESARSLIAAAVRVAGSGQHLNPRDYADILQGQANITRTTGDLTAAIIQYREALAIRLSGSDDHGVAGVDNECWLALALLYVGEEAQAEDLLHHCEDDLKALDLADHPVAAVVQAHLAIIAEMRGEVQVALDRGARAATALSRAQHNLFPGFSRRMLASPILNSLVYLHLQNGDPETSWRYFSAGHQLFASKAQYITPARQEDPQRASRVRDTATLSAHMLGEAEAALVELRRAVAAEDPTEQPVRTLIRYAKLVADTHVLTSGLRRDFGEQQTGGATVAEIQQKLAPNQAIIGYFLAYERSGRSLEDSSRLTYAVVVRHDRTPDWVPLFRTTPLSQKTTPGGWSQYRKIMDKASDWPVRLPDDPKVTALRHELYQKYFAPLQPHLAGVDEVLLLAVELESGFPFPALIDDDGQPLVDRYAFRHLLGINAAQVNSANTEYIQAPSLILGDPAFTGNADGPVESDPTLAQAVSIYANTVLSRSVVEGVLAEGSAGLNRLPRLRSSGWEARGIAGMTAPVTLLTGTRATEQSLNLLLRQDKDLQYRWIHLATHALVHNAIPERSALALTPQGDEGLLYVDEMGLGWALNCDLVTLSGCQTGNGPATWSSGPLGFIQALHAAGARNLLLSTSKVDDIATALLMEKFYANISNRSSPRVEPAAGAPLSYSRGLAAAQVWLRDLEGPDGRRPFAHPVYWANFRLLGRGR